MEPTIIAVAVEPQDLLAELVKRRATQLLNKYPSFSAEFTAYSRRIKKHSDRLKEQQPSIQSELFERVLR